jgi:acyl-CoA thioesterase
MNEIEHPYADTIGIIIDEKNEDHCRCHVTYDERLMNPNGVYHGGVLYSLADTGMGGALHALLGENQFSATIEIKITYFHPVRKADIYCISKVIKRGKRVAMMDSELFADNLLVAKASGSFAIISPDS